VSTLLPLYYGDIISLTSSPLSEPGYFPQTIVQEVPAPKLGFREQVIADAKIIRGTLLGKPETKEHGQKILRGEVPAREVRWQTGYDRHIC